MKRKTLWLVASVALALHFTSLLGTANAHENREAAGHKLNVGWLEEPAYAGVKNDVFFRVTEGDGAPREGLQMKVEVIFGDKDGTEKIGPLDLRSRFGEPGSYVAPLIPTRPGKYTFHITGDLDGQPFDQSFTSSEGTFDEIKEPTDVQFPAKDPSVGELAERSERLGARVDAAVNGAEEAKQNASTALGVAYGGALAGVLSVILAIAALVSARRRDVTTAALSGADNESSRP